VPRNLKYVLSHNFGQFYPAPYCRSYSVTPHRNAKQILQSSVDQLIERLEQVWRVCS
jgi:hypothetical protein